MGTRGRAASSEPPTTIPRRRRKNKRDDWVDRGNRTPKATRRFDIIPRQESPSGFAREGNYPCLQCNLNFDTRDKWWLHVSKARCGFIYGKLRCYVCGVQNDPFISHAPRYYYRVPGGKERYVCD